MRRRWLLLSALACLGASPAAGQVIAVTRLTFKDCRQAQDQPICLLAVSTRASAHPLDVEAPLALAPEIVKAADQPDPALDKLRSIMREMFKPQSGAVAVLRADAAGATPADALATLKTAWVANPADSDPGPTAPDADERIRVYNIILQFDAQPIGRDRNRRPSSALLDAIARAACADLRIGREADKDLDLVRAELASGAASTLRSCLSTMSAPNWRLAPALVQAGLADKAVAALAAPLPERGLEGAVDRRYASTVLNRTMKVLADAGLKGQALQLARIELDRVLDTPDVDLTAPDNRYLMASLLPDTPGALAALLTLLRFGEHASALSFWSGSMRQRGRRSQRGLFSWPEPPWWVGGPPARMAGPPP